MTPPPGITSKAAQSPTDVVGVHAEQLFHAIFEQAVVGVALIETDTGRFLRVNQRCCDIVGLPEADLLATTYMAITHPDDLPVDLDRMEELKAGRIRDCSIEKRLFRSDGSIVRVQVSLSPLWCVGEQPSTHLALVQDITEQYQAQAPLQRQIAESTVDVQEQKTRLAHLLDHFPGMVAYVDRTLRYHHASSRYEEWFGKKPEEVIGGTIPELLGPEAFARAKPAIERALAGEPVTFENHVITPSGEEWHGLVTFAPDFDAAGGCLGFAVFVINITEHKQAEAALRDSEERLRLAQSAAKIGTFDWDIVSGKVLWQPETERIWGLQEGGYEGTYEHWRRMVHPEDLPQAEAIAQKALADPDERYAFEHRILWPDGTVRWIFAKAVTVWEAGKPIRMVGLNMDITERKQAEEALVESEERFRHVFQYAGTGIAITDLQGRFLHCNPAYCDLLGYTEAELRELDFSQVVHPDDRAANLAEADRLFAQEVPFFKIENRSRHKDGHDVWVHKVASMLRDEVGHPKYLFALVTDVTEQRHRHALLEQRVADRTAEVRAREAELTRLVGHFPGVISRVGRDLRYHYVSPQYEEWFGKKPSEIIGCTIPEVIGQAAFEQAKPAIEQALAGERVTFENAIPLAMGEVRYTLVTFEPEFNQDATCTGFAVFVVDITEQRRDTAFLAAEKQTLELVAKGIHLNEVLAFLCRTIEAHTAPMLCAVMLVTEDGAHLTSAAAPSLPDAYNRAVDGIAIGPMVGSCGSAAYFGKPSIVTEIATHPLWEGYAAVALQHGLQACWSQPILSSSGAVLGTFAAYYREPRVPQPNDLKLVERATHLAQLAIEHARVTEALGASETRFQAFMNHSPVVAFIKDGAGRYLYVNATYEQLFHVSLDHIRGKADGDWLPKELAQRLQENDRQVLTTEQSLQFEETVPTPDGGAQHWLVMKFPLRSGTGEMSLGGVAIDITPMRRAEVALRESEERYSLAVAGTTDGIWDWNITTGDDYLSPRWKALLGYQDYELLNREESFFEHLHPDDRDRVQVAVRAHLERQEPYAVEFRLRKKDGSYAWFLSRGQAIWNTAGQPIRMVGAITDITERKQAEVALRDAHVLLNNIINASPDLIFVKDRALRTLLCNNAFAQAQGKTPGELIGHTDIENGWDPELVRGNSGKGIRGFAQDDRDALSGRVVHNPSDPANVSGEIRIFDTFKVPLQDAAGRITGVLGVARDITDRKKVEEALRDSYQRLQTLSREVQVAEERERSRLSRELHDEFGQLLSVLKFSLSAMDRKIAERAASWSFFTKQVQGALATVDRLFVSLRSMVGGLRPPVLEQLGLIAALKALASEVVATSGVRCRVLGKKRGLPKVLPVAVEGALYRIAQELLMNVVRHAKATEVTVTTSSERGGIVLTVQDNGRGFNVTQREKNNRFGLRGVHERVELLGGTVTISSTRKVGTTVVVHVPIESPGSSQCQTAPDRPIPSRAIKKRRRRGT